MAASKMPDCDFGIDYTLGFEALLPHLGYLRRDARMLEADAVRLAVKGDAAGAGERLAAVFRMARQCGNDGVLISSLVGAAIAKSAAARADALLGQGKLDGRAAPAILEAARSIAQDDPFGMRASINAEGIVLVEAVRRNYTGPDAGRRFAAFFAPEEWPADKPDNRKKIAAMNGEQLLEDMQQAQRSYAGAVEAWDKPDARDRLRQIADDENKLGPAARMVAPALLKAYDAQKASREAVDRLIARLEKLAM